MALLMFMVAMYIACGAVALPVSTDGDPSNDVHVAFHPTDGDSVDYNREGPEQKSANSSRVLPGHTLQDRSNSSESSSEEHVKTVEVVAIKQTHIVAMKGPLTKGANNASEEDSEEIQAAPSNCIPGHVCYGDSDCYGGRCFGLAVGKCNCGPCMSLVPCSNDQSCGGLRGACDLDKSTCDCAKGFRENGFRTMLDAWRTLCNYKDCTATSDNCYGLPCNSGTCAC